MVSRARIHAILSNDDVNDKVAIWYNRIMVFVIILCLVPLWFKEAYLGLRVLDRICASIFIFDYVLRWITADFKLKRGKASFLLYPITPMAILDLLSILPSFAPLSGSFKAIRILRIMGALRAFKLIRFSKTIQLLMGALYNQRMPLLVILVLGVIYVVVCATVMFNVEPEMFGTFIDALYWAVISLTTIGYGDLTPTSEPGRVVVMVSAFVGVAIIALPSGIITAGLIEELNKRRPRGPWDRPGLWDRISGTDREDQAGQTEPMEQAGQAEQATQVGQAVQTEQATQPSQADQTKTG